MGRFDIDKIGKIKIFHLVNFFKYQFKPGYFKDDILKRLQFELQCLNNDDQVDYEEFISVAFRKPGEKIGAEI